MADEEGFDIGRDLPVFLASGKEEKQNPERPRFDIPAEMLEEMRELRSSWITILEK